MEREWRRGGDEGKGEEGEWEREEKEGNEGAREEKGAVGVEWEVRRAEGR